MRAVKRLLWWLIAGSEGGLNRARIIFTLKERPYNAKQLSEKLGLNYTTVRYHLKVLESNNLIISSGKKYGKMYFLSSFLLDNYEDFEEIWAKIMKKKISNEKNKEGDTR